MKSSFLLLAYLFFALTTFAQTHITLKGKVVDDVTKEPLSYAYVSISNVALGTVTNGDGDFVLNIPAAYKNNNIVFSYMGYTSQTYTISVLQQKALIVINLETDTRLIKEVVVKPRKKITAKQLLKKVINRIEENYAQVPVVFDGYYRESIAENGAFISYADAAVEVNYSPYQEKPYRRKDYRSDVQGSLVSLGVSNFYNGRSLHQWHFHSQTTNKDQARVIDCRSSLNQTKTDMRANIQGGPMGIFSTDYLKYKEAFFGEKMFKQFNFELGEVLIKDMGYVYVLSFRTVLTKEIMEELDKNRNSRAFYKARLNKVLQGKIYVDRDDFAVLKFETSVVPELKQYFCSYTPMNYKHFDYKLNVEYQKIKGKYYLKYLRHEDEFILNDTIANNITPYYAVNQFWVDKIRTENVVPFKLKEVFANQQSNQLFDLPLDYNKTFWEDYSKKHPIALIPDSIRKDMEGNGYKPLEQQFVDKHKRNDSLQAPVAKVIPTKTTIHKTTLVDDYAWLKQSKKPLYNPDIKSYLEAENQYMDNYFIPLRKSQRELFAELTSRVDKDDESIPREKDGYWYQTKMTEENEYPIYLRRKEGVERWDTIMDINVLAEGKDYYSVAGIDISPNTEILLYFENTTGSDNTVIKFKNITTNQSLSDSLLNASDILWLNDHQLIYSVQEAMTNRAYQVKLHELGRPQENDSVLFQEDDPRFSVSLSKSKSKQYIYLNVGSKTVSETYFMSMGGADKVFHLICPREKAHKYSVTDYNGEFYIISNCESDNLEVFKCSEKAYSKANWKKFLQPEKGSQLFDFEMFDHHMVVGESYKMLKRLKIIDKETGKSHYVKCKEDLCSISTGYNPKFNSDTLDYTISSMKTPLEIWHYNMKTGEQRLVKRQEVHNYFKSPWIKNELVWAQAKDGTKIPITLLYRHRDVNKNNKYKRMFMTSYGSYGAGIEAGFNSAIYSLIERGFVYAIAHVRGGGELGKSWHDGGKLMNKKNTFTDFIDCAEFLIAEGYAQKGNIVAQGASAGGLLMGNIINMRPDLFKMVILDVPFVDIINTMLDETLPLTTLEYDEWGDPNKKTAFDYMLSYSPYDNVKAQDYPHLLFTTGVNDAKVGYWEPAKMVAKLRKLKTNDNLLFLKTDMYAGHAGGSGRFNHYKELAYKYAIIFDIFSKDILEEAADNQNNN